MIVRAQCAFPMDSALPRDVVTINPHFNTTDAQAIADILKSKFTSWVGTAGKPFTIKVYDAKQAPPSYPLAIATAPGTAPTSTCPREVALCLSYYAVHNRPGLRGRLFIPASWITAVVNVRPTTALMNDVLALGDVLGTGLPSGSFWTVYSRKTKTDAQVTDVWVDDEWDTVRSRGLKGSTRVTDSVGP